MTNKEKLMIATESEIARSLIYLVEHPGIIDDQFCSQCKKVGCEERGCLIPAEDSFRWWLNQEYSDKLL